MFQHNTTVPSWQRRLLIITAIFSTLLIAAGGVLCATGSIRDCPDWPGCFGKVIPPLEKGPLLEVTHRSLAAITGLLVIGSSVSGMLNKPRLRWVSLPPLVSLALLLLVSYFGAQVVLRGLAPGWAAVDVGSALMVVALMIIAAVVASKRKSESSMPDRLTFRSSYAMLVLVTACVVYVILLSGVLVAGDNPFVGCLGWPIYSAALIPADALRLGYILRMALSILGVGMIISVFFQSWRYRKNQPGCYQFGLWVGIVFLVEMLIQGYGLLFVLPVGLMVAYSITAALFWALLVGLLAQVGVHEGQ